MTMINPRGYVEIQENVIGCEYGELILADNLAVGGVGSQAGDAAGEGACAATVGSVVASDASDGEYPALRIVVVEGFLLYGVDAQ